jgi:hypothetical protein
LPKRICLPCASSCDGCLGPEGNISSNGCKACKIDLYRNTTLLGCYDGINSECPMDFLKTFSNSKHECRSCHEECDGCTDKGNRLEKDCVKCKNFIRNATSECVKKCDFDTEYPHDPTKVLN